MLTKKLKQLSSNRLVRNLGWLGGAELILRVFRLVTTVTLARVFTSYEYGMVSIIYTVFEFGNTLSLRAGIAAKLIQTDEQELAPLCQTAYWLNWILCGSLFLFQCLAAYPIAQFYDNNQLILPICALGLSYLLFPNFLVQSALIERQNRLQVRAWCQAGRAVVSNVVTVSLALLGMGAWAVVWSIVLSYFVWIAITYLNHPWRPKASFSLKQWRDLTGFGSKTLGVELLSKFRLHIDYLLVGNFLGIEALGMYSLAFNAGLGISQSVLNALSSAWYPHFCQVRTNLSQLKQRYFGSLKTIAIIIAPIVTLQIVLAPLYVPIVFGEKWLSAIPILRLICLSALPTALSFSVFRLLQAVGKPHIALYWNLIFTSLFTICLLVAVQGGIIWVAIAVLAIQLLATPIFTAWVTRYVFRSEITTL
jgi:PST family polysaccharide transporter